MIKLTPCKNSISKIIKIEKIDLEGVYKFYWIDKRNNEYYYHGNRTKIEEYLMIVNQSKEFDNLF